jgi:undecaprenyl-diphosphatase
MPLEQIITLALIQGITEFLPISSSAHLILVPYFAGWDDQGPLIDVSLHVGTLFAVMLYFWRDLATLLRGLGHLLAARTTPEARLLLLLVMATLPVLAAGYALQRSGYLADLRSLEVIAWANLGFALLLWASDSLGLTIRRVEHTSVLDAITIGLAQVLSLVPGTSRAGITMTAARLLGYERPQAARFSMLLSIPTIAVIGAATALEIEGAGDAALRSDAILAAALAFVAALIAIWFMMALLRRTTMFVFVAYRLALGAFLLAIVYGVVSLPGAA